MFTYSASYLSPICSCSRCFLIAAAETGGGCSSRWESEKNYQCVTQEEGGFPQKQWFTIKKYRREYIRHCLTHALFPFPHTYAYIRWYEYVQCYRNNPVCKTSSTSVSGKLSAGILSKYSDTANCCRCRPVAWMMMVHEHPGSTTTNNVDQVGLSCTTGF